MDLILRSLGAFSGMGGFVGFFFVCSTAGNGCLAHPKRNNINLRLCTSHNLLSLTPTTTNFLQL